MRLTLPPFGAALGAFLLAQLALLGVALYGVLQLAGGKTALLWALGLAWVLLNAAAIWTCRHYQALQESARRLNLLAEMNVQVNREILLNEDIELIYRTILNYLFSVFDKATTGSVLILGADGHLTFAASRGFSEAFVNNFHLRLDDCFLYQVTKGDIKEARLISQADFVGLETVFKPGLWEYQSVISAPLFVGDRLFGLLNLDSPVSGTYDQRDVEIVERFRSQIEIGLLARDRYTTNIQRYQVDSLTGLLTRRYFEDLLKVSLERALRNKEAFVLALFDVDGLKRLNDTHGHLAGDQMLLAIANALRSSCRASDIMGRLGGDEFIACYHQTDMRKMDKIIAAIRARLRQKPLRIQGAERSLSFSYGLAHFPEDGLDLQELMEAADRRLYAMKFAAA